MHAFMMHIRSHIVIQPLDYGIKVITFHDYRTCVDASTMIVKNAKKCTNMLSEQSTYSMHILTVIDHVSTTG